MKIFKDRQSAGKLLAKRLKHFSHGRGIIVLGIPRGGVVVAKEIAKELKLPLDIIVARKIGAPFQKELALGAVDTDGEVVWDERLLDEVGIKKENLETEIIREVEEIKRREDQFRHASLRLRGRSDSRRRPLARLIAGKTVILVDDGIATGATTLAAIRYLKRHQVKKIVLAVPVASKEAKIKLEGEADELIILETPEYFQAVGQFYQTFEPVSDEEVIQYLHE